MKSKKMMKNLWMKLTVAFMLANIFVPSVTVFADETGTILEQAATEKPPTIEAESPIKEDSTETVDTQVKPETENPVAETKSSETTVGESQNANDSPIVETIESGLPVFEVQEPMAKMITFNENGTPLLDGEAFYKTEEQITNEDLKELMIQGNANDGYARMVRAGVTIEYLGQVTYGYNIVGHFKVNGQSAFCIEHAKPTPPSGTPAEETPYDDDNIAKALYYGWDGAENIFTDFAQGYTATSLVLSYFFTGVSSGINTPEGQALLNKVATSSVPKPAASFSKTNPVVSVVNGEQRSENITLNGDSRNIFKMTIPAGMTIHVLGGGTLTNGIVDIKGGDTFYLTANMKYTNNYASGALQGSMRKWQPILTKPNDGNLQTLGRAGWIDPQNTLNLSAKFFARTGNAEFLKVSAEPGTPIANVSYDVTIDGKTSSVKTDANGQFSVKDILDGTVVTVKETANPAGYVLDTKEYTVTIAAGETKKLTLTNAIQKGKIKGLKKIEVFNPEATEEQNKPVYDTKPGANITFDIVAKTDTTLPDLVTVKSKAGTIVDTVTTNAKGEFSSNVELYIGAQNKYQLVERNVPANYRQPSDVQTSFAIPYGKNTEKLITFDLGSIDNLLKTGEWKFNKLNELTQMGLKGATFLVEGISVHNKTVSYVFTSAELGNVFKLPAGNYKVTEISFPDGFGQATGESETKIITIKDTETTTTNWNNAPELAKLPKMGTQAFAENGGKDFDQSVDNVFYDKIKTENFDKDTNYYVTKVVGERTDSVYYEAKSEYTTDENGEIIVKTMIPANTIKNENVYLVEEAYPTKESYEKGDKPYSEHNGKGDYGQTLFNKEKPVVPATPVPVTPAPTPTPVKVVVKQKQAQTVMQQVKNVLPQTGETSTILFMVMGVLIIMVAAFVLFKKNKRPSKEKLSELAKLYGAGGAETIFTKEDDQEAAKNATTLVILFIESENPDLVKSEECRRLLKAIGETSLEQKNGEFTKPNIVATEGH